MRLPLLALAVAGMSCTLIAGESIVGSRGHALTINDAVELALKQNPSILVQIQQLKLTRGLVFVAQANLLPHLTMASNYSQQSNALSPSVSSTKPNFDLLTVPNGQPLVVNSLGAGANNAIPVPITGLGGSSVSSSQNQS